MKKKRKKKNYWGKKKVFILPIKPYSQELMVVCNGQFSDAIKKLKKLKSKNAQETLDYIEKNKEAYEDDHKSGEGSAKLYTELPYGYVMIIDHLNCWIKTVGLVVHETTHLVFSILNRAGITLIPKSEESFTYLIENTVEEILKEIYPKPK